MSKRQAEYRNALTKAQDALNELSRRHLPTCISPERCITCELIREGLDRKPT